jgi:hypothetical protein
MKELDFNHPHYLPTEGNRGFTSLCGLAGYMGYDTYPQQLYNSDGTTVSSLMNMLEDNPGMVQAIFDWIDDNKESYECFNDAEDEDDDEDEEIEDAEADGSVLASLKK